MVRRILATTISRQKKDIAHDFSHGNPMDKAETIPEVEEMPLLQCTHLLSKFIKRIENWRLDDREWELLRTTPFGTLIEGILEVDMNVEILDALLGFWDEDHCGFVIGGSIIPFTADDIALITGLPNRGLKVVGRRKSLKRNVDFSRIYMSISHIERRLDCFLQISRNSPNSENDKLFVQHMILYFCGSVLFPNSCRIVPEYMSDYVENLEEIGSYNWAEAIHLFLVKEINVISKTLKQRNEGKKVVARYINGPTFAINVWFFEHVNFGEDLRPSNPDVKPRILKWLKVCKLWQRKPFLQRFRQLVEDKVFHHILPKNDELDLLSLDKVGPTSFRIGGSDDALRGGPSHLGNSENTGSDIKHKYERVNLKVREPKKRKNAGKAKIKFVAKHVFVNLERLAVSREFEIDEFSEPKDREVDEEAHDDKIDMKANEQVVCHLNEAYIPEPWIEEDKGLVVERIAPPNLIEIDVKQGCHQLGKRKKVFNLPIVKERLILKGRRNVEKIQASIPTMRTLTGFWRKDIDILVNLDDYSSPIKQKKGTEVAPLNYVGRELLTENERKYLDAFCINPMQRDDIVFFNWNIAIRRHSMVEYLQGGYTGEEIIDAYARILYRRDDMSEDKFASFLYVPPMFLGLYRNKLGSYKTFLNYVDKKSLEKVKFLFLPCLITTANHWLLLVCHMDMHKWIVYDSLYDPRHRGEAKEQIMLLTDYLYQDHGFDIRSWSLDYRRIYPQQEPGTLDCGIFVMKFIENIMHVRRTINFRGTDMQLFRPQIAYRILCHC